MFVWKITLENRSDYSNDILSPNFISIQFCGKQNVQIIHTRWYNTRY